MKKNKDIEKKISEVLDTIRPFLYTEGGDIEFIKYKDGYVYVKLLGLCQGCEFSDITLESGIYETLKQEIPEIKGVIPSDF